MLKGIMRSAAVIPQWTKIDHEGIGYERMRLNYQSSSHFGTDASGEWKQHLHTSLCDPKVKIYFRDNSKAKTLLIALRTDDKRASSHIKSRVMCAIGEVLAPEDGRGFVVPYKGKGPKYLAPARSYSTRSERNKSAHVIEPADKVSKDYEILAKHWFVCNKGPKIFKDLTGLLKLESL